MLHHLSTYHKACGFECYARVFDKSLQIFYIETACVPICHLGSFLCVLLSFCIRMKCIQMHHANSVVECLTQKGFDRLVCRGPCQRLIMRNLVIVIMLQKIIVLISHMRTT